MNDAQAPKRGLSTGAIIAIVVVGLLFVIVAIVGILAALGISGARKYVSAAKASEGTMTVNRLASGMALCGSNRADDGTSPVLPETAPPVPATLAEVSGKKYMSAESDWSATAYSCAAFSVAMPQYFRYQWLAQSATAGVARGEADLDGDGVAEVIVEATVTCPSGAPCVVGPVVTR